MPYTSCPRGENFTFHRILGCVAPLVVWCCGSFLAFADAPANGLLREVYSGGGIVFGLTNIPPDTLAPGSSNYVTDLFEAPSNVGITYGQRMHGYVIAPSTGNYTFWIASDDNSVLLLSTGIDPANAREIASVPTFVTAPRDWSRFPQQQ